MPKIGNQIELEITPHIARFNSQGFFDFEELTTVVRVSLGNWVDIGGTMQSNDEISRKILRLTADIRAEKFQFNGKSRLEKIYVSL